MIWVPKITNGLTKYQSEIQIQHLFVTISNYGWPFVSNNGARDAVQKSFVGFISKRSYVLPEVQHLKISFQTFLWEQFATTKFWSNQWEWHQCPTCPQLLSWHVYVCTQAACFKAATLKDTQTASMLRAVGTSWEHLKRELVKSIGLCKNQCASRFQWVSESLYLRTIPNIILGNLTIVHHSVEIHHLGRVVG